MNELNIKVNEGEILLSIDDFYNKRKNGEFVDYRIDEDDYCKLIGVTEDNTIYVSERPDDEILGDRNKLYYDFVIRINPNEIPVSVGDFHKMQEAGEFVSCKIDEDDFVKVIGIDKNGIVYVSERISYELSDDECTMYFARKGITGDLTDYPFSSAESIADKCKKAGVWFC